MQTVAMQFSFKGQRPYVQGPDIVNAAVGLLAPGEVTELDVAIHRELLSPAARMEWATEPFSIPDAEPYATLTCAVDGLPHVGRLVAGGESVLEEVREPYPENDLWEMCEVTDRTIRLSAVSPFTFLETVVSMNKLLHLKTFGEQVDRWIFVRIELQKWQTARAGLEITLQSFRSPRLTRSEIRVDGQAVGKVYFSGKSRAGN